MKRILFVAALVASTAAVAQNSGTAGSMGTGAETTTTTSTDSMDQNASTGTGTMSTTGTGTTTGDTSMQGSMSSGGSMGGTTVAPGNAAPERDARGIAVVSDAAMAPPGANAGPQVGTSAPNPSAVFATQPSSKEYKACTRTVTDGCVQTYERGRAR